MKRYKMIWAGIGLAILFWIIESYIHVYIFHHGDLSGQILLDRFIVDANEAWMRSMVALLFIAFGFYSQFIINKRRRAEEALQKAHDELEGRIKERTSELADANTQLKQEIEQRLRAESEMVEANQTLQALIKAAPLAIVALDTKGKVIMWNPAAEEIFGWSEQEALGRPNPIVPTECEEEFKENLGRVLGGDVFPPTEERGQRRDGSPIEVQVSRAILRDSTGKVIGGMGMIEDITDRKRTEEKLIHYRNQLQHLVSELSLAEERERRRLASDLHDSIGQILAVSKIKADELLKVASTDGIRKELAEIGGLISEAVRDMRSLTFELSPPILHEFGLEAALEALARRMQETHRIRFDFWDDRQPKPLSEEVRAFLYGAAREALVNVVKHAQARNCNLSIGREGDDVKITIQDDGVGFECPALECRSETAKGFGLFSISERLRHINGHFEIESKPENGTLVMLMAPLLDDEKSASGDSK